MILLKQQILVVKMSSFRLLQPTDFNDLENIDLDWNSTKTTAISIALRVLLIPNSTGYPCYHLLIVGQLFSFLFFNHFICTATLYHSLSIFELVYCGTSFSTNGSFLTGNYVAMWLLNYSGCGTFIDLSQIYSWIFGYGWAF